MISQEKTNFILLELLKKSVLSCSVKLIWKTKMVIDTFKLKILE